MATVNVTISPIIAGVYIVLEDTGLNTCQTLTTSATGVCSFTSLPAGDYSLYNVGIAPNACPPTICGFPAGYTGTTTPRRVDFTLTATATQSRTFNYDKSVPWSTLNGGNPPIYALTTAGAYDLATGNTIFSTAIANNGMGYCMQDNFIYGSSGRSGVTDTVALSYPFSYITNSVVGDCDENGYFYSPAVGNSFTCICVDSYSPKYLRACNPYNNYAEVGSPYYVAYTAIGGATSGQVDWSYVPSVKGIVNRNNETSLFILSLTTPIAYTVPVQGTALVASGVTFADGKNFYQPTGSQINKFLVYTTIAYGTVLGPSTAPFTGDGARAVGAPVFYAAPIITKKVDKTIVSNQTNLLYTVTIVNRGITPGLTGEFSDTLPDGTSFIPGTVKVDGVTMPSLTPNSITLGSLPIGQIFTVNFQAQINSVTITSYPNLANVETTYYDSATSSMFNTTFESNIVVTTLVTPSVVNLKTVSKTAGAVGDILTYTIVNQNLGTTITTGFRIIDTIPVGATFVSGSLTSNGITIPTGSVLPPSGYLVGTLAAGQISTISFKVNVVSVPTNSTLINYGTSSYTASTIYGNVNFMIDTNTVATIINYASFSNIKKNVDKVYVTSGQTITYTIVLPNSGNTDAFGVSFVDTIPNGLTYVPNSLIVNGVATSGTPNIINIGTIASGEVVTILYQMLVN